MLIDLNNTKISQETISELNQTKLELEILYKNHAIERRRALRAKSLGKSEQGFPIKSEVAEAEIFSEIEIFYERCEGMLTLPLINCIFNLIEALQPINVDKKLKLQTIFMDIISKIESNQTENGRNRSRSKCI